MVLFKISYTDTDLTALWTSPQEGSSLPQTNHRPGKVLYSNTNSQNAEVNFYSNRLSSLYINFTWGKCGVLPGKLS